MENTKNERIVHTPEALIYNNFLEEIPHHVKEDLERKKAHRRERYSENRGFFQRQRALSDLRKIAPDKLCYSKAIALIEARRSADGRHPDEPTPPPVPGEPPMIPALSDLTETADLFSRILAYYKAEADYKTQVAEYHRKLFDWESCFLTPTVEEIETWVQQNLPASVISALPDFEKHRLQRRILPPNR